MNKNRAWQIIDAFAGARVLVVGDIILDQFIWGKVSRISPEAPVPVVEVDRENYHLGGSANVMNNISAVGGGACLAGVVGNDEGGQLLRAALEKKGIDGGGIVPVSDRPTTRKTRVIAHGQQVVRVDREVVREIDPEATEKIITYIGTQMTNGIGAIIISDYHKGVVTDRLMQGIRALAASEKLCVCIDPKRSDFSFYQGFSVITPNHHEAYRALGLIDRNAQADHRKIGEELLRRHDFQAVLLTRGENGMSLFEKAKPIKIRDFPAKAKEVYDVTGAGDTVIAIFALAVAAKATFTEAAYLANHAAGIVVGKLGTATITRTELMDSL
jgi:D-beta-D-heptose 7-phosphate kinase/D-beta-D-heptose 1-phosphate adenosyltransferase